MPPIYAFLHLLARGLLRVLAPRLRVTGRHNIPYRGAVLFAPNHISDADPPIMGLIVRRRLWFMAKRELWDIPFLGPVITWLQSFPVDPESPDRAALKRAAELLKNGEGVVIFPEGRVSHDGEMSQILPGVALLALKSDAPIVPVGIVGANHLIPYGSTIFHFTLKPVSVHFGAPLDFTDLKALPGREAREQAARRLENAIRDAIQRAA